MSAAIVVARLLIGEAARRKLLLALLVLTLIVIALTLWGFSRINDLTPGGRPITDAERRTIASQLLILVMFMFSWVLSLAAVFVAAPAISGELESGIAAALLARPLSRVEYVVGKWLGLLTIVLAYGLGAAVTELVAVNIVIGYLPPHPIEFLAYILGEGIVLLSLALALSTRLSGMVGGVICAVLFGMAWMGGIIGGVGTALGNESIARVGTATRLILPTDGLWRGAVWSLEPAAIIAANAQLGPGVAANPFFAASPPPAPYIVWAIAWVAVALGAAVVSFRFREV